MCRAWMHYHTTLCAGTPNLLRPPADVQKKSHFDCIGIRIDLMQFIIMQLKFIINQSQQMYFTQHRGILIKILHLKNVSKRTNQHSQEGTSRYSRHLMRTEKHTRGSGNQIADCSNKILVCSCTPIAARLVFQIDEGFLNLSLHPLIKATSSILIHPAFTTSML